VRQGEQLLEQDTLFRVPHAGKNSRCFNTLISLH
jgi:hypothetical protein